MPNLNLSMGSLKGSAKFSTNREFKKMVSGNETLSHALNSEKKKQNFYADLRQEAVASGNLKSATLQNVINHAEKEKYLSSSARAELKKGLFSKESSSAGKGRISQGKQQAVEHRNNYAEIMGKRISVQSLGGNNVKHSSAGQPAQRISFASSDAKMHQAQELIAKRPTHEETAPKVHVDKSEDQLNHTKDMIARITGKEN